MNGRARRVIDPLSAAIFDSDLVATRLTLALAEVCWCVMLLWPGDTMSRPTYALMAQLAPEPAWMLIFGFSAITQFYIVLLQEFEAPWARFFAAWNATLWVLSVGTMLFSVYPPPAAVGGEIALMGAAVWIFLRPMIIKKGAQRYGLGGY